MPNKGVTMIRTTIFWSVFSLMILSAANAETIVTHETEKYFYKGGKMDRSEGQYENTYYLDMDKNTLTRTRIYDYQTKKITPDETVYQIETTLKSHPTQAARFGVPSLIRAVGRPDKDSVQTVTIDDDFVTTSTSTADTYIISRAKRFKENIR